MNDSFTNYFQVMVASMWILLEMVLIGAVLLYATVSLVLVGEGGGLVHDKKLLSIWKGQ